MSQAHCKKPLSFCLSMVLQPLSKCFRPCVYVLYLLIPQLFSLQLSRQVELVEARSSDQIIAEVTSTLFDFNIFSSISWLWPFFSRLCLILLLKWTLVTLSSWWYWLLISLVLLFASNASKGAHVGYGRVKNNWLLHQSSTNQHCKSEGVSLRQQQQVKT